MRRPRRPSLRAAVCVARASLALASRAGANSPPVAPTDHLTPDQEKAKFHLPPGFEAQLVASEPEIQKPMNINFDARGRLWLTDTIEYPFPVAEGMPGRDTVKVLEDLDETGHARKITTFATGLNVPLGIMPIDDGKSTSAIVYSVPEVRHYVDTNGDGKADKSVPMLGPYGHVDTHGMTNNFTRGFDPWVYAEHGFRNDSDVRGVDGSEIKMNSGNCYRFRPDGTRVEFYTHGQVNPFGLCFDPLGNLFSADCETRPQYMLLRGAYYPSFGKPDDGLGFAPEMCDHKHGSTAISGTIYYAATQFPSKYWGTLLNGNVVTNNIDADTIEWHGSSPKAIEAPEFLVSDDPWFRPVQIKVGPDGAVYVADFYNKIIGHYEVDLKHPGRDHASGRIWRIVYKGDAAKVPAPVFPNLAALPVAKQVEALADPNLTIRLLATNHLADTGGQAAVEPLRQALAHPKSPEQRVHVLWVLHRLGALPGADLSAAAGGADRLVRTHAMRILGDLPKWDAAQHGLALAGLKDADPFVRRRAADAVGLHPDPANVRPLFDAKAHAAPDDSHLIHVVRIALRDTLSAPGTLAKLPLNDLSNDERKSIADVILAVPGSEAGAFVVSYLKTAEVDRETAVKFLRHAARYVPEQDVDGLASIVTSKFGDDTDLQLELFKGIREGLTQRGATPGKGVTDWGRALAARVLKPAPTLDAPAWTSGPVAGSNEVTDPWAYQARQCADGKQAQVYSSFPKGEQLTGVLRSRAFDLPPQLSFYLCGHNGQPPEKLPIKNVMRLRAEGSDEVLAETPPPRNDVAQRFTWNLKKFAGKRGYIEVVDGDDGTAYAWIAFGRLEPAVVPMPTGGDSPDRTVVAADIAAWLKLADLTPALQKVVIGANAAPASRAAAAKALMAIDPANAIKALSAALDNAGAAPAVREAAAAALAPVDSDATRAALVAALQTTPQNLQKSIALGLAGNKPGAETLLDAIEKGKASARLLQDKPIRDRLNTAKPDKLDERVAQLTKGMVSADEAIQKLIDQRAAGFKAVATDAAKVNPVRGHDVFAKNCAACHQVSGEGARIGPGLDGVGKRGPDRIAEDILDPSRNVDAAFRYSVIKLKSGDVLSGLQRREEGQAIVFADGQGKEFSVPRDQIESQKPSLLSLMPGNFGDQIPPEQFNDLLAFLLSK